MTQPGSDALFHPTDEHRMLRQTVADFVKKEVEEQTAEFDEKDELNVPLFRKLGELDLLGITVPEAHGGAGMDTVAAVIVHEELSKSDPGFCLAYLAHSMLFVNNFYSCSNDEQKARYRTALLPNAPRCATTCSERSSPWPSGWAARGSRHCPSRRSAPTCSA